MYALNYVDYFNNGEHDSVLEVFPNKQACVDYCNETWGLNLNVRSNLENELYGELCGDNGCIYVAKNRSDLAELDGHATIRFDH